ncbi:hypothetical protein E4U57_001621 [Claviceps arundinis]|uniref:Cylicin I n=1 Tax=Claviceps arundinis TaxID=1623583 RepID=A0ABQ7PKZ1_9HYPO|nr:hypothetical protein E4U57_001621 [Claviceps arundinis]
MTTYSTDPALYIFTSLTAGSSHIVTATSRLETILRANRVPFKAVDIAVDDKARMLWGRRAGKDDSGRLRKLPGLVQEGLVIGDLVEIEDWNEYGELKQHVKIYYDEHTIPNIHNKPPEPKKTQKPAAKPAVAKNTPVATSKTAPTAPPAPPLPKAKAKPSSSSSTPTTTKTATKTPDAESQTTLPMRSVADEAAQKAKELRLKSLREKVHGKKADSGAGAEPASKASTSNIDTSHTKEETVTEKSTPAGLQSPTSSTWQNKDAGSLIPQSPTSGKWRPSSLVGAMSHDGAVGEGVSKGETGGEKEGDQDKVTLKDAKAEDDSEGSKEGVKDQSNDKKEVKDKEAKKEEVKKEEVKEEEVKKEEVKEEVKKEDVKKEDVKNEEDVKKEEVKEEDVKKEDVKKEEAKKEEVKKEEVTKEEESKDGAVDGSKEKTQAPPPETAESKKDDKATGEAKTEDAKTQ